MSGIMLLNTYSGYILLKQTSFICSVVGLIHELTSDPARGQRAKERAS